MADLRCPRCTNWMHEGVSSSTMVHPGPNQIRTEHTCRACGRRFAEERKGAYPEPEEYALRQIGQRRITTHDHQINGQPNPAFGQRNTSPSADIAMVSDGHTASVSTCRGCGITSKQRQVSPVTLCCPTCEELRDRFAGQELSLPWAEDWDEQTVAGAVYDVADAMLEARKAAP